MFNWLGAHTTWKPIFNVLGSHEGDKGKITYPKSARLRIGQTSRSRTDRRESIERRKSQLFLMILKTFVVRSTSIWNVELYRSDYGETWSWILGLGFSRIATMRYLTIVLKMTLLPLVMSPFLKKMGTLLQKKMRESSRLIMWKRSTSVEKEAKPNIFSV